MNARHSVASTTMGLRVSEAVLGIVGVVAVFVGTVILLAGDDQYIGLGGDASWRVGDIALAWGYGLLAAGVVVVLVDAALVRWDRHQGATAAVAQRSRADLALHGTVFVLVNAFIWIQDIAIGGGVNYAWWITIPWGVGLAVHAVAVYREG